MKANRLTLKTICCLLVIFLMMMLANIISYADTNIETDELKINTAHVSDGIVLVQNNKSSDRKAILYHNGNKIYTYTLSAQEEYTIPITDGNGKYCLSIYEHIHDSLYSMIKSKTFDVTLKNEFSPFLSSNAIVDYDEDMELIKTAIWLKEQHPGESDYISSVYQFVSDYDYDYEKSMLITTSKDKNYVPDIGLVSLNKKGICFDFAAVMVAMLRSQDIPAKLEFGFVNNLYHAWVNVYQYDSFSKSYIWKIYDPTFAASADPTMLSVCMRNPDNYKPIYVN